MGNEWHRLCTRIPDALWRKLTAAADAKRTSVTVELTGILCRHYHVATTLLPARRRAGRKPKQADRRDDSGPSPRS